MICLFMYYRVRSENWKTGLERKLIRGNWFKIRQPRLLVNIIRATAIRVRIFWKYLCNVPFLSFSFLFFLSVFFFICCLKYSKTSRLKEPGFFQVSLNRFLNKIMVVTMKHKFSLFSFLHYE